MSNLTQAIKIYDIECYPNLFMVSIYSYSTDKFYTLSIYPDGDVDDRNTIIKYFLNPSVIWCGYNNLAYDDAMIHYLLMLCTNKEKVDESFVMENKYQWDKTSPYFCVNNQWYKVNFGITDVSLSSAELTHQLYKHSKHLISTNSGKYIKKINIKSIDLLEIIRKGYNIKSLKGVAINLNHNRIQDLPIAPDDFVSISDYNLMEQYNVNDVIITRKVFEEVLSVIEMRSFLTEHYNGEVDLLSESDSGICKKLLTTFYQKKLAEQGITWKDKRWHFRKQKTVHDDIPIIDIVYDRIYFSTPTLQKFYEEIKQQSIIKKKTTETSDNYEWNYSLEFAGNIYSLGLGGIHTEDKPLIASTNDDYIILDLDCTSMYPNSFIYNSLCPAHLDKDIFLGILKELLVERVKYKKLYKDTGDKSYDNLQAAMKIALNTFFGLTNSKTFWLFDPKATFTCTVNNQLLMLMLVEDFTLKNYPVISANTDGITVKIKPNQLEQLREDYAEWENMSGFKLEETFYEHYIRRDINNYIAVTNDGKLKQKGVFVTQDNKYLLSSFEYPIVAKALNDYFLNSIPIEKTVKECTDIYSFCFSQKCGKQFTNWLQHIERKTIYRYGKNNDKVYTIPKIVDTILKEEPVQRNLRIFVSLPEVFDTKEPELFKGYGDEYYRGYSLKKKKMRETNRFDVIKDETVKKCWWIVDLLTNEKIGDPYPTKKSTIDILKALNTGDDALVEIEQSNEYVAGKFVTLFNDYFPVDKFEDYRVDYDYYLNLIQKEIDKVELDLN